MNWTPEWIENMARDQLVMRILLNLPSPHNEGWDRSVRILAVTLVQEERVRECGILLNYENRWWEKRVQSARSSLSVGIVDGAFEVRHQIRLLFLSLHESERNFLLAQTRCVVAVSGAIEISPTHPMVLGEFARILGRLEERTFHEVDQGKRSALSLTLFRLDHFYNKMIREIAKPLGLMS
ncbi:MAG: hypothetical protein V1778_02365 [bacterium]